MNTQTVSTVAEQKTSAASLQSKASGWNMRVGIPFTLIPEKKTTKTKTQSSTKKASCSDKTRTDYKYRCRMQ